MSCSVGNFVIAGTGVAKSLTLLKKPPTQMFFETKAKARFTGFCHRGPSRAISLV
jgi:hypothetical protein